MFQLFAPRLCSAFNETSMFMIINVTSYQNLENCKWNGMQINIYSMTNNKTKSYCAWSHILVLMIKKKMMMIMRTYENLF